MPRSRLVLPLAITLLMSCDDGKSGGDEAEGKSYAASGRVLRTDGAPIEGVAIVVDDQLLYDSNVVGRTDAQGRYRIALPKVATTWHTTATHTVRFHGRAYAIPLDPDDDSPFAGNHGGVRDFTWRLVGERPDGGFYGSDVVATAEIGDYSYDLEDVELTLVPEGAIVDGTQGETVVGTLENTPDGYAIPDVPLARYTITARLVTTGEALLVRLRDEGAFSDEIAADFDAPYGSLPIYRIAIDLQRP